MENLSELKQLLSRPQDILIVSHRNPDGDAVGSSLALYHFLNKFGHTVRVVFPSEYPHFLEWMPSVNDAIIYDLDEEVTQGIVDRASLVFCLDFNALDRIDKVGDMLAKAKKLNMVMIDHHLYPENFADFVLSDTTASSTSELIFDFIEMMGEKKELDPIIGKCIFTGILTDTGSFKYSTSAKLFRIVAELLDIGVDDYRLQDLIFNNYTEKQLKLLGHCLYNQMEILPEFKTGIITLTKNDYETFDIQRGDTEGIVNYLLKMPNIKIAAFITEQPKIIKVSLRSKGDFSVQEIATKYFKGGGHKNASGGYAYGSLKATVNKFKAALEENKAKLLISKG